MGGAGGCPNGMGGAGGRPNGMGCCGGAPSGPGPGLRSVPRLRAVPVGRPHPVGWPVPAGWPVLAQRPVSVRRPVSAGRAVPVSGPVRVGRPVLAGRPVTVRRRRSRPAAGTRSADSGLEVCPRLGPCWRLAVPGATGRGAERTRSPGDVASRPWRQCPGTRRRGRPHRSDGQPPSGPGAGGVAESAADSARARRPGSAAGWTGLPGYPDGSGARDITSCSVPGDATCCRVCKQARPVRRSRCG